MLSLHSRPRGILIQLHLRLRIHGAAVRDWNEFQRASLHGGDGIMFVRIRDEQGECGWVPKSNCNQSLTTQQVVSADTEQYHTKNSFNSRLVHIPVSG